MLKKYFLPIVIILAFLTTSLFAQFEVTKEQKNEGIEQMKSAVSKLSLGMTKSEVDELIGRPTFETSYGHFYCFSGEESIALFYDFFGKLSSAANNNNFDLLATEYTANGINCYFYINGKEIETSNPVVFINGKIYISTEELEKYLVKKVVWNTDKEQLEITKNMPATNTKAAGNEYKFRDTFGRSEIYHAIRFDFPVFIDGKKILTSNSMVTIDNKIYVPIEELEEELEIKTVINSEKLHWTTSRNAGRYMEITTNVPVTDAVNYSKGMYPAIVSDFPVFINGEELLTVNPIFTIYGKVYIPIEDVEEYFGIKVSQISRIFVPGVRVLSGLNITTKILFTDEEILLWKEKRAEVAKLKEDVAKLRTGMTIDEVKQVLGEPNPELKYYVYKNGETLVARYDKNNPNWLTYISNYDGFNLLSTGDTVRPVELSVVINDEELFISNPMVMSHNKIYAPIVDFAEALGIIVSFNKDKELLEIITK